MDPLLTPDLALAYLRELSVDVLAAVVLDGEGRHLAGDHALASPGRALLDASDTVAGLALRIRAGWVIAARAPAAGVVVATGPLALVGLMRHDVVEAAALLGGSHRGERRARALEPSAATLQALGNAVDDALVGVGTRSSGDR